MTALLEQTETAPTRQSADLASRLNWLRAGVLGANDGIVSVAATVIGVAAATDAYLPVLLAGIAAVVAGALSMALGEYVSVSSASDSQRAIIKNLRRWISGEPKEAFEKLSYHYQEQGLSKETAEQVASELTAKDPLRAHLSASYHLAEEEVVNPWQAALASGTSFLVGALLPLVTVLTMPVNLRIAVTALSACIALGVTGGLGAWLGKAPIRPAMIRVLVGGALALLATWGVGSLLGTSIG